MPSTKQRNNKLELATTIVSQQIKSILEVKYAKQK
jgi:hypothetical protein